MLRDEDDLQLLAEVAGVLDQVVLGTGLSPGSYLLLRELVANPDGRTITQLAESFEAAPDDVVSAAHALSTAGLSAVEGTGVVATGVGRQLAEKIETDGNAAIRDYVLGGGPHGHRLRPGCIHAVRALHRDRPHGVPHGICR